jgi:uncharacterized protein YeaO (DUF488 family)
VGELTAVPVAEVRGAAGSGRGGRAYLVDRLWPRGVRKDELTLDGWLREVAPSTELRRWFGHDPDRWEEFRRRYAAELDADPQGWAPLLEDLAHDDVLLVFSARDHLHNNAVALRDYLLDRRARG